MGSTNRRHLRPCLTCGTPARGPYCAEHDPEPARRRRRREAHGLTAPEWQELRLVVLTRDGYRCRLQVDERCTGHANTVHLDPALRGDHRHATPDDCVAACRHCHGVIDAARASRAPGPG